MTGRILNRRMLREQADQAEHLEPAGALSLSASLFSSISLSLALAFGLGASLPSSLDSADVPLPKVP